MDTIRHFFQIATEPRVAVHNWEPGIPYQQPYYAYSPADKRWRGVMPPAKPPSAVSNSVLTASQSFREFTVMSWNIDFMLPLGKERLTAALNHVHDLITQQQQQQQQRQHHHHHRETNEPETAATTATATTTTTKPNIILLQEMTNADLRVIQAQPWIQAGYYVTDISNSYWASNTYGTCTLVPKGLDIRAVFRVHYQDTAMERDGLFVDIDVGSAGPDTTEGKCLRICNTHLESLAMDPPMRPSQMACAAEFMRGAAGDVLGSVLGGDLNAIQPFDKTLPVENGLGDAYLASGGEEGREDSFTWGQMARTAERDKYGLSRMDKLLFCGAVEVRKFERFGYGVELGDESQREQLLQQGLQKPWVTDHVGVKGDFHILVA